MSKSLLSALLLAFAFTLASGPARGAIIAHYRFDEGSGTTVNDASGNGNTLTFGSTPTWNASGAFGGSVSVAGQGALARDGSVNPGTINNFQGVTGNQATVAFWARTGSESLGSNPFYIGDSSTGQGNRILASHLEWNNGVIYWDADWGDGTNQRVDVGGGATADTLHHYAMTYRGDTGLMRIYKDAVPIKSNTVATDPAIGWNSIRNIEIGANSFVSFWNGTLDEFAVWDEALTGDQVLKVMNRGVEDYQAPDPEAIIIPNSVDGRFIRVNKTKPNNADVPMHIGEIQALLGEGLDLAVSSNGATATTVHGTTVHGADGNLINSAGSVGGSAWTRDDQQTGPGVYEVEGLVDLGQTSGVQAIQLLQRGDNCCPERLQDFTLTFEADDGSGNPGAVVASQYYGGTAAGVTTLMLAPGQTILPGGEGAIGTAQVGRNGRFIQVENNGVAGRRLHTSEIEAFAPGVTANNNAAPSTNDIAGTTFQSQVGSAGHGSVNSVVDGNLETGASTWTREGVANSYTVDLGSSMDVETVRVWQRADGCCHDRLSDFTVSIFTDDGSGNPGGLMATQSYPGQPPLNSYGEVAFPSAFAIGADDTLKIEIDPVTGTADLLSVGPDGLGDLVLASGATLDVSLLDGVQPGAAATFNVLDFGSLSGTFGTINLPVLTTPALYWDVSNLHTIGELAIGVPEPSSFILAALGILGLGLFGWRRKR